MRIRTSLVAIALFSVGPVANAHFERQWYSCECVPSASATSCKLGARLEAGLSKDTSTGKISDYSVEVKAKAKDGSTVNEIGIWDPAYFADDIGFDHKISGFEKLNPTVIILQSDFAKKAQPKLKVENPGQEAKKSDSYSCKKI